ncbi:hypothetical protein ACWEVD_01195 [Nocardia thailandica]
MTGTTRSNPERSSFSATDEVWNAAKGAWVAERRQYPTWAEWLETALAEKAARVRAALGNDSLPAAPDRLPPGRRSAEGPAGRKRRSFTCTPQVWQEARDAWWAQSSQYWTLTDWIEEAIAEKAAAAPAAPAESVASAASS